MNNFMNTKPQDWCKGSMSPGACFGDASCVMEEAVLQDFDSTDSDAENRQLSSRTRYQQELSLLQDFGNNTTSRTSQPTTMGEVTMNNRKSFDSTPLTRKMDKVIKLEYPKQESSKPEPKPVPQEIEVTSPEKEKLDKELARRISMIEKALKDVAKVRVLYDQKYAEAVEKQSIVSTVSHTGPPANERPGDRLHRQAMERQARLKEKREALKKHVLLTPHSERAGNRLHQQAVERQKRLQRIALSEDSSSGSGSTFALDRSIPKAKKSAKKRSKKAYRL